MEARRREPHLKPGIAAAVFCRAATRRSTTACLAFGPRRGLPRKAGVEIHRKPDGARARSSRVGAPPSIVVTERGRGRAPTSPSCSRPAPGRARSGGIPVAHRAAGAADQRPDAGPAHGPGSAPHSPRRPGLPHSYHGAASRRPADHRRHGRGSEASTRSSTAGGLLALLDGAWRAVPAIEELPIAETWVGFRPGSRDDAPILGPSGIDGLAVATGHHRNGILLTPVTAAVDERVRPVRAACPTSARPFSPERFAPAAGLEAAAPQEAAQ